MIPSMRAREEEKAIRGLCNENRYEKEEKMR
jgi:hypothetical protein